MLKKVSKPKKEVDMSMYHNCRWCKHFNRSDDTCSKMSDELDVFWENEDALLYKVAIMKPEEFSCCKWE